MILYRYHEVIFSFSYVKQRQATSSNVTIQKDSIKECAVYTHLFGPIASRRLGTSLGVDLVTHKVCSLDCIYCEAGATTNLTLERKDYIDFAKVKEEIAHYLVNNPAPDYVTFSGAGEPTLSIRIGETIEFIKSCNKDIKVAVLTNGTLLHDASLRSELLSADLVIPSLDAAAASAFRKINRPEKNIDLKSYVEGIKKFREEFSGTMPLEILILPGVNDDDENLQDLRKVCSAIQPDYIQLNTLDRPGVIEGLSSASTERLQEISAILCYPDIRITASSSRSEKRIVSKNLEASIIEIVRRRPSTVADIVNTIETTEDEVHLCLTNMVEKSTLVTQHRERGLFYLINN